MVSRGRESKSISQQQVGIVESSVRVVDRLRLGNIANATHDYRDILLMGASVSVQLRLHVDMILLFVIEYVCDWTECLTAMYVDGKAAGRYEGARIEK